MNSQKQITLGVIGLVLLVAGGGIMWLKKGEEKIPTANMAPTETPKVETKKEIKLTQWRDEAGFTFEYPQGLEINNHPENKTDYSYLTLTLPGEGGNIEIKASDTTVNSIGEWAQKIGGNVIDSQLGGKPAKKIATNNRKLVIGLIDNDVLFTLEGNYDQSKELEEAWEKITDSFTLVYPTAKPQPVKANTNSEGDEVLEEE